MCHYDLDHAVYQLQWKNGSNEWYQLQVDSFDCLEKRYESISIPSPSIEKISIDIEGCVPRNTIEISQEVSSRLINRLTNPKISSIQVPHEITVYSKEEVMGVKAEAIYTDGYSALKKCRSWILDNIDFTIPGTYSITGKVKNDYVCFPVAINRADPNIIIDGMASSTLSQPTMPIIIIPCILENQISIPGIQDAEETLILDSDTYPDIKNLLWAPRISYYQ